jgi:protein-S-isoprenylcysteine O-methyltransferase Ste14
LTIYLNRSDVKRSLTGRQAVYTLIRMSSIGVHGERHLAPAAAWAGAFVVCAVGDWFLGRWVLVPVFVAAFYGGMIVIDLLTYPMLSFWRGWLRRRGLVAWYLVEVVGMWGGTTLLIVLLAPWWLSSAPAPLALRVLGCLLALVSVGIGTWACYKMGWARLLFAGALFLPGAGAEENRVPQRLVVEGPYRHVRNPLYISDFALILGTALLANGTFLFLLAALYVAQLALQLPLEERELYRRFGSRYGRYCELVPRFVPRIRPISPGEIE